MTDEVLNSENDMLAKMMKDSVTELSKYFDSVQIFCTKHESDKIGTTHFTESSGNYFSRFGQITLWVKDQNLSVKVEED